MNAELRPRRGTAERVTGAIWGAIVAATGGLLIAALSGFRIDLELFAIIALVALGAWLLFSALASASRQNRRERAAVATETPAPEPAPEPTSEQEPAPDPEPEDRKDP
ncbi:hypothetical protein [Demequina iriomotensis]|uniref:hypothetical protein n=1 Tax=Demequina iriomotensis TaxID=1536641 RepID=UPI0007829765|nr:hypothetical protein [Demequina iriomotensis]